MSLADEAVRAPSLLIGPTGESIPLPLERWSNDPSPAECELLGLCRGPVLDIGCGPGRLVLALARRGVASLGIDVAPAALIQAHRKGAPVLDRSVFDSIPGTGRWNSALLLDGNIGIGGRPSRLLTRVHELLGPRGELFVECGHPGTPSETAPMRIETQGSSTHWFPWARVSIDDIRSLAARAGFVTTSTWTAEERWFAALERS